MEGTEGQGRWGREEAPCKDAQAHAGGSGPPPCPRERQGANQGDIGAVRGHGLVGRGLLGSLLGRGQRVLTVKKRIIIAGLLYTNSDDILLFFYQSKFL